MSCLPELHHFDGGRRGREALGPLAWPDWCGFFAVNPEAEGIVECSGNHVCSAYIRLLVQRRTLQRLEDGWLDLHEPERELPIWVN